MLPPYLAFRKFKDTIEALAALEQERLSPAVLTDTAGKMVSSRPWDIINSMKFLGFAEEDLTPTELWQQWVRSPQDRPDVMWRALKASYRLIAEGPQDIGEKELENIINRWSLSESVQIRARRFLMEALNYAAKNTVKGRAIDGKRTAFRPPRISKSGGSSLEEKLPPVIVDLLREVPPVGEEWPGLKEWMDFFAMAMRRYYGDKS
ncbi:MAG: DUF5343 domain-containing protein [Firmicutes bacterium]|nr:DUF5343 domain-containing protein [Bacillota bacterium]